MALVKTAQQVFHAAVPGQTFRAYSRTCPTPPPPPPPKRWVTKTVCGSYTRYGFYAYTTAGVLTQITETVYVFDDYPSQTTVSPNYDTTQPSTEPMQIGFGPYCMKVTVYE